MQRIYMQRRPRWDADGGLWYVAQGENRPGVPTKQYRWKPNMNTVCEPLLGRPVHDRETGKVVGVTYPSLTHRLEIYREGLRLIEVFGERTDLFTLAVYRRQVREIGPVSLDWLFLELAERMVPALSPREWGMLSVRMPERSHILNVCLERSCPANIRVAAE